MTRYLLVFVIAIMLVLLVSAQAMAYRVVLIPSGDVLPEGMVKLEYGHVVNPDHHSPPGIDWFSGYKLDARLPGNFEVYVNVKDTDDEFGASDLATDVSVQYLALQETAKLPNLSVGVWNINQDSPAPPATGISAPSGWGRARRCRCPA